MHKIEVCKLGLGDTTADGPFWPKVDGKNIGENGRAFWPTRADAHAAAERYVARLSEVDDGTPT